MSIFYYLIIFVVLIFGSRWNSKIIVFVSSRHWGSEKSSLELHYFQDHIDAYRETQILPKSGAQETRGHVAPDVAQKSKLDQNNSSDVFSEPATCPRHSNNLESKIGEISNFRHLLGLENTMNAQHKPRSAKDSKEIMKKRRERAICIVSHSLLEKVSKTCMQYILSKHITHVLCRYLNIKICLSV